MAHTMRRRHPIPDDDVIAVVAATPMEVAPFAEALTGVQESRLPQGPLVSGHSHGKRILLLAGGIGKANAAAATALLCQRHHPRLILAAGIGGAFPRAGPGLGDIVLATHEILADEGVQTGRGFSPMETLGFSLTPRRATRPPNTLPLPAGPRRMAARALRRAGVRFFEGAFVTLSTGTGTDHGAARLWRRYRPLCESMEGGAVVQVAYTFEVPVLGLRSISNLVGQRRKRTWKIPDAVQSLSVALDLIIESLGMS